MMQESDMEDVIYLKIDTDKFILGVVVSGIATIMVKDIKNGPSLLRYSDYSGYMDSGSNLVDL